MNRRLFLDIETLPPVETVQEQIAADILATTSHEPVDHEALEAMAAESYRNLALTGEQGRVLTIGMILEEDAEVVYHGVLGLDRESLQFHLDEARTIRSFWRIIRNFNLRADQIIGHNVLDFDLPFLQKRSVIHQIRPSIEIPFRRYQRFPIYDTMWEWTSWRNKISLDHLARALGVSSSKGQGIDGSQIYDAWRAGRHQEIASYCMRDVECVREIYYKMNFTPAPFLQPWATKAIERIPVNNHAPLEMMP